MVTTSSFQIPFKVGDTLNIFGQTIVPVEIGTLLDGSIDRSKHPKKEFCVPIQLADGTYRIVNCTEQNAIELVDSDDIDFINRVHHSADMPQAYHTGIRNQIRICVSDMRERVFEVLMSKSSNNYVLQHIRLIAT